MKIVIISPMKLPIPPVKGGGVENLIQLIVEAKENISLDDLDLTVISPFDEAAQIKSNYYRNTKYIYIDVHNLLSNFVKKATKLINKTKIIKMNPYWLTASQISQKLKLGKYDIIIVVNNLALLAALMQQQEGHYILHLHNDIFNAQKSAYAKWVKACQKIITVSEYIKNQVLTVKGINKEKVYVLNNCIDLEKFESVVSDEEIVIERNKLGISAYDTVLLYSGRIVREKGVLEFIHACKDLVNKYQIKIMLVGGSWYSSGLKSDYVERIKTESASIKESIIFTGFIDYAEMPKVYAISDVSVVPTLFVEDAAPLVVIESLAAGLPLIVTDSGGIPEYVSEDCAIILKRDDDFVDHLTNAIEQLVIDEDRRRKMGLNSRSRGKQYSRNIYFNKFVEIVNNHP